MNLLVLLVHMKSYQHLVKSILKFLQCQCGIYSINSGSSNYVNGKC